jgi:Na+/H+ antiporter NhaD/arsenite permease-like protein
MPPLLTPGWAVLPFVAYLLGIAGIPHVAGHFWKRNRNKLLFALLASVPIVIFLLARPHGGALLGRAASDYVSFMALLGALFTISGGIRLRGALVGTPLVNTALLALGVVLGSVVGTVGASVLLIRPLLRANERRGSSARVVVFFIFIVSNAGGLLTPLGAPLYLGFLRGVPFTWTLRLIPEWALVNGLLLSIFAFMDTLALARCRQASPPAPTSASSDQDQGPLRIDGALNLLFLFGVVAVVLLGGSFGARLFGAGFLPVTIEVAVMVTLAAFSFKSTAPRVHETNRYSWTPLVEVAVLFMGIFVTMTPALSFLSERGASLGVTRPWQFFWAAGALSSVLDNAPTYLAFAALAAGVAGGPGGALSVDDLSALAAHPVGQHLLAAVSCGAVFMGALTYIGNGPNFMVKAIAEQHGVRMPSFFGYTLWSFGILVPIFVLVSWVFF